MVRCFFIDFMGSVVRIDLQLNFPKSEERHQLTLIPGVKPGGLVALRKRTRALLAKQKSISMFDKEK